MMGKKKLVVGLVAVVVLALGGGAAIARSRAR
jgi:hypothetical protein